LIDYCFVSGLFERGSDKNWCLKVKVFHRLFISALPLEIQLSRGRVRIPLTCSILPQFVPVSSQGLDFQHHMSQIFLMFNDLRREVIIHCGTGSSGATIRLYIEGYESNPATFTCDPQVSSFL
jgi:hypothetical protein